MTTMLGDLSFGRPSNSATVAPGGSGYHLVHHGKELELASVKLGPSSRALWFTWKPKGSLVSHAELGMKGSQGLELQSLNFSKWQENVSRKSNPSLFYSRHEAAQHCSELPGTNFVSLRRVRRGVFSPVGRTASTEDIGLEEAMHRFPLQVSNLADQGQLKEALRLIDQGGMATSFDTYVLLLQGCSRMKCLAEAKQLHAHMTKNGVDLSGFLGNSVVDMFVKCGSFPDALLVFNRLGHRNATSWTAIITGNTRSGQPREALRLYRNMREDNVKPNKFTFLSLLKACSSLADLKEGKWIHQEILSSGLHTNLIVATSLLDMYAKCGSMADAQRVFDTLPTCDVVAWNAMITGYAQQEQGQKVFELFAKMKEKNVRPDDRTFVGLLKACGSLASKEEDMIVDGQLVKSNSLQQGRAIHAEVRARGYESDEFVGNKLVDMYSKCGSMVDAQRVFDNLSKRDVISWTAMILGYAQQEEGDKALQLYLQMQREGISPDARSCLGGLKACASLAADEEATLCEGQYLKVQALSQGKLIHAEVKRRGFLLDPFVGNTLLHMYAKCGDLINARRVFDTLPRRNVVSWNAMLAAYTLQEQSETALQLYEQMQEQGVGCNDRTLLNVLRACSSLACLEEESLVDGQLMKVQSLKKGSVIHEDIIARGYESMTVIGSALVDMYAKCGNLVEAQRVFDKLPQRDVLSWTALIGGYAQQEQREQAMQLYEEMQKSGVRPNSTTFLCILEACSCIGALNMCIQIHDDISRSGIKWSKDLATTLIHAYGKCGSMVDAQRVFEAVPQHDVLSWTALIAGYARQGESEKALQCFEGMKQAGTEPNGVTFLAVLSVCTHAGLVESGLDYFGTMKERYGISPRREHYACLVDLLGRAGLLQQAEDILRGLPMKPDLTVWLCLLGACRTYNDVEIGRRAFECAVKLDPKHCAAYVLMSNIYASAQMWEEAQKIQELRGSIVDFKKPGQSWIEQGQTVHVFSVGDKSHLQIEKVYEKLGALRVQMEDPGLALLTSAQRS